MVISVLEHFWVFHKEKSQDNNISVFLTSRVS